MLREKLIGSLFVYNGFAFEVKHKKTHTHIYISPLKIIIFASKGEWTEFFTHTKICEEKGKKFHSYRLKKMREQFPLNFINPYSKCPV